MSSSEQEQNPKNGKWHEAIPLPLFIRGGRKQCQCGRKFFRLESLKAHYALEHIVRGNK